ncbi:MAG: WbqC family protein [Cyanobacteria bacterium HKST-UBA03]|nr:WbqC family protein [Cyanobacteria bacterium HKST-UBA03]
MTGHGLKDFDTAGLRCSIMQPTVWPWLGYFDLMDQVDVFVLYDDVQLSRQSWMTRNRILTAQGPVWLPVPVKQHGLDTLIVQAEIDDTRPWRKKQCKTLQMAYGKAPYFEPVYAVVESLIQQPTTSLAEFNVGLITHIARCMGIETQLLRSSALDDLGGQKDARVVSVLQAVGAQTYVSAQGASAYIEANPDYPEPGGMIAASGIELLYHQYHHPVYPQVGSTEFVPYIGVLDAMFNVGWDNLLPLIRQGRQPGLRPDTYRAQHRQPVQSQSQSQNQNQKLMVTDASCYTDPPCYKEICQ